MHDALRRLDLNLLLVFDALFRHRSVVLAADELAISPSACSHALSRLRSTLSDELFVRYANAMQPTAQAEQLAEGVAAALEILSVRLSETGPFVPATSAQTFIFAATDFTAFALLPALISRFEKMAPKLHTKVIYSTHRDSLDELTAGTVHFALGFSDEHSSPIEGVEALDCGADDYVVVARQGHPRISGSITMEEYLAERHVVVKPWRDSGSVIDASLAKQGCQRDVAVQLPSVLAAPFIVAQTDMLITLPRIAASQIGPAAQLQILDAPFETPRFTLKMLFHVRHMSSSGHRWVREQMVLALRDRATESL